MTNMLKATFYAWNRLEHAATEEERRKFKVLHDHLSSCRRLENTKVKVPRFGGYWLERGKHSLGGDLNVYPDDPRPYDETDPEIKQIMEDIYASMRKLRSAVDRLNYQQQYFQESVEAELAIIAEKYNLLPKQESPKRQRTTE